MSKGQEQQAWGARPLAARSIKIALFVIPFLAGWIAIRLTGAAFFRPSGKLGIAVWIVQAILVSAVASSLVGVLLRRLTPLPALLGMSLVFPDYAPSRFRVALRAGTVRKLIEHEHFELSSNEQEAAEQAVHLVQQLARHERLTRGHTERVRAYTDLIAEEMGLDEDQQNRLRWGSLLHDVGKLKVPAEILSKDGAPTAEEWEILRRHPGAAVPMLAPLEGWLGEWLLAASEHHERWDGTGYPLGLAGREISLAGRITAVADAYDVITSRRSYKAPMSAEAARRELVAGAGTQFDPAVVRAMLEVGLQRPRRATPFGWLLELPSVARIVDGAVAAPLAAAVSVAALTSPLIFSAPPSLPLEATASAVVQTTTSETSTIETATTPPSTAGFVTPTSSTSSSTTTPTSGSSSTAPPTTTPPTTAPPTTAPPTTAPPTTAPPTTAASACEQLKAGATDLEGADLRGCNLSGLTLDGVDLGSTDLTGANLRNLTLTNFGLANANLTDVDMRDASFASGSMVGANLERTNAERVRITAVNMRNVFGSDANFQEAVFENVNATSAVLPGVDFEAAKFTGVTLSNATLTSAVFSEAKVGGTTLTSADLTNADLEAVDLRLSLLDQTNLSGVELGAAKLTGATGTPIGHATAIYDGTTCPDGSTTSTGCW